MLVIHSPRTVSCLREIPKISAGSVSYILTPIALFTDWSILYVTVIIFGIIMAIGGIVWAICFCMGRYSIDVYVIV